MSDAEKKFEKLLEDIAAFFALAGARRSPHRIPLTHFNGAEPFSPDTVAIFSARFPGYKERLIPNFATIADVRPPFDISMMVQATRPNELFALMRHREVSAKEVRGRVRRVLPRMIEVAEAPVRDNGGYSAIRYIIGTTDLRNWTVLGPDNVSGYGQPLDAQQLTNLKLSLGVHFVRDWDWRVTLGYVGHPTLSFITDPVGAAEVFRLRDVPNGKTRRSALLHWVREHWRQQRKDPDALTHVREHLRGAQRFTWNDLTCQIVPAPLDVRRAEAAKQEKNA